MSNLDPAQRVPQTAAARAHCAAFLAVLRRRRRASAGRPGESGRVREACGPGRARWAGRWGERGASDINFSLHIVVSDAFYASSVMKLNSERASDGGTETRYEACPTPPALPPPPADMRACLANVHWGPLARRRRVGDTELETPEKL